MYLAHAGQDISARREVGEAGAPSPPRGRADVTATPRRRLPRYDVLDLSTATERGLGGDATPAPATSALTSRGMRALVRQNSSSADGSYASEPPH
jgi:hypothetical protein